MITLKPFSLEWKPSVQRVSLHAEGYGFVGTFQFEEQALEWLRANHFVKVRCAGCGCNEQLDDGGLCCDCRREHSLAILRMDEPKSWQQQLANAENPPL